MLCVIMYIPGKINIFNHVFVNIICVVFKSLIHHRKQATLCVPFYNRSCGCQYLPIHVYSILFCTLWCLFTIMCSLCVGGLKQDVLILFQGTYQDLHSVDDRNLFLWSHYCVQKQKFIAYCVCVFIFNRTHKSELR